ncbi:MULTISPECIES: restriction endonuclease [unclassified Streptomyces]|uniref:restriction endonuclease n=1 Tax=unclassified Streptomyces TaxID=2593676 RepID=UPI002E31247F|nr:MULTISPECIES: restriction endonuclease [unclassified Streptomyces]WUC69257.1 restriction endonuclease [Streptomyces sp. NBC_00539]
MIIDRDANVTPHRYQHAVVRKEMGRLIARGDKDDLLACLLWTGECRIAETICKAWEDHVGWLRKERDEAKHRSQSRLGHWDQVSIDCRAAASDLQEGLEIELVEAKQALAEATVLSSEISEHFGLNLEARAQAEKAHGYTLDTLAILRNQLEQAQSRLADLLAHDRRQLHDLAITESFKRRAERTLTLAQIDQMSATAFRELVQQLLATDVHPVVTPVGRSLLASLGSGRRISVTAKHVRRSQAGGLPNDAVSTSVVHEAHRAAVSADAEAIVVTNGTITQPALRYAAANQVRLIDRTKLQRWAEWGEPMTPTGAA